MTVPEKHGGPEAEILGRFEPGPYDLGITEDPEPRLEAETAYGPQLPGQADLWQAQAAPWNEPRCSDAEWERLIAERHQTEAAYLARVDAEFAAEFEAAYPELAAEAEAEP